MKMFDKGKRLEQLILDFTKWLDKNYKTATVEDVKKYWKKLIEDYAFEQIEKVVKVLGSVTK